MCKGQNREGANTQPNPKGAGRRSKAQKEHPEVQNWQVTGFRSQITD